MNEAEKIELLKKHAPVLCFTIGESFYPIAVDEYIKECSLWVYEPGQVSHNVSSQGTLTLENLAEKQVEGIHKVNYLKFIEPLNIAELAAYRLKEGIGQETSIKHFKPGSGRLARVGFLSRLIDAVFTISLLARGRVPGDTATAAIQTYQKMMRSDEQYQYYGRVVEYGGWIALQYWYFYPFNDWRSGFKGVNDHEGDWEMACVYLYRRDDGELEPAWAACSNHDYEGDDLRRHWQDSELKLIDGHPVLYTGAGSHSNYFCNGEYIAEAEISLLTGASRVVERVAAAWRRMFNYQQDEFTPPTRINLFRIPFVDYARGDGQAIGYKQLNDWKEPVLIDPMPDWVQKYHGLWGFFARDPVAGENAPAGPRFNRNGSIRRAWYDPFGWVGLDKVPPPNEARRLLELRLLEIEREQSELLGKINTIQSQQYQAGIELTGVQDKFTLNTQLGEMAENIDDHFSELRALKKTFAHNELIAETLKENLASLDSLLMKNIRSHLVRPPQPESGVSIRFGKVAELWSAVSISLMMVTVIALALFARQYLGVGLGGLVVLILLIEAGFKHSLLQFTYRFTVLLSFIAAGILLVEFFWPIIFVLVFMASVYILWDNLAEIFTK